VNEREESRREIGTKKEGDKKKTKRIERGEDSGEEGQDKGERMGKGMRNKKDLKNEILGIEAAEEGEGGERERSE
jgi:hypothetical protein